MNFAPPFLVLSLLNVVVREQEANRGKVKDLFIFTPEFTELGI